MGVRVGTAIQGLSLTFEEVASPLDSSVCPLLKWASHRRVLRHRIWGVVHVAARARKKGSRREISLD